MVENMKECSIKFHSKTHPDRILHQKPHYKSIGQILLEQAFCYVSCTMVKTEYEYILITVRVTSTLLWQPSPGFMYFTSAISQIAYFCQNWHKAFSICTTIQKCAGFRDMGQCRSKPKRRETYMFYTVIISAVSCRMMHETWGDSEVWRIEKPLAWENQCLVNRTFYTTWFYHHCGYITKILKNKTKHFV
jgi:hypothetical protein